VKGTLKPHWRTTGRILAATALLAGTLGVGRTVVSPGVAAAAAHVAAAPTCILSPAIPAIKHVVYIEFDNVHFKRDPARDGSTNVPSDLEQMPNLLNFMTNNGTLLTNVHTPLISHTSDDITASESGYYPSNSGIANSANSYYEYGSNGAPTRQTGFTYWTSKTADGQYNFVAPGSLNGYPQSVNAPAPWVPYTRAGCNVGAVAMSGLVLENSTDVNQAFGSTSPAATDPNQFADYLGVAVHCAAGDPLCSANNSGAADKLPNEPNPDGSPASTDAAGTSTGYQGYNALYGSKALATAIGAPNGAIQDLNGNTIVDDFNNTLTPGFPGFSIDPRYSLGYAANMLEHNVPVVYAYVINAHNPLSANPYGYGYPNDPGTYGPGQDHYVSQLQQFNTAFGQFFNRLKADGIDKSNTQFVFTTDEEDHHISETPSPAGCDGVTTPCTYPVNTVTGPGGTITTSIGELNTNYTGLLKAEQPSITTPSLATVNADDAPDIYLNGQPGPTDPTARAFERATAALTATNPLTATIDIKAGQPLGNAVEPIAQYQADLPEARLLHMVTGDPLRTPTFVTFAQPDYYLYGSSASCSANPGGANACTQQNPGFNWNHGDVQPQISQIWAGFVGPGVANNGLDGPGVTGVLTSTLNTFADHVDERPTMLGLLGLPDDHPADGRVLIEDLTPSALPFTLLPFRRDYAALGVAFKQINSPLGQLGMTTLVSSTIALASNAPGDATYSAVASQLTTLANLRDALASSITAVLSEPFDGGIFDDAQAQCLTGKANALLATGTYSATPCPNAAQTTLVRAADTATVAPSATNTTVPTSTATPVPTATAVPTNTSAPTATPTATVAPTSIGFPATSGTPPATSLPAPTALPTSVATPSSGSTPAAGSTSTPGKPGKPSTTSACTVKLSLYAAKLTFGSQTFTALPSLSISSVTRQGNAHPKITSTTPLHFDDAGTTFDSTDSYTTLVCGSNGAATLQGTLIGGVATVKGHQTALAGSSFTLTVTKQSGGRYGLRVRLPRANFDRTYSKLQGAVSIKQ